MNKLGRRLGAAYVIAWMVLGVLIVAGLLGTGCGEVRDPGPSTGLAAAACKPDGGVLVRPFTCTSAGVPIVQADIVLKDELILGRPVDFYTGKLTCTQPGAPLLECRIGEP